MCKWAGVFRRCETVFTLDGMCSLSVFIWTRLGSGRWLPSGPERPPKYGKFLSPLNPKKEKRERTTPTAQKTPGPQRPTPLLNPRDSAPTFSLPRSWSHQSPTHINPSPVASPTIFLPSKEATTNTPWEPSLSQKLSGKICQGEDQEDVIYVVFEGEKRRKEVGSTRLL